LARIPEIRAKKNNPLNGTWFPNDESVFVIRLLEAAEAGTKPDLRDGFGASAALPVWRNGGAI
jgi:hypothetical protein